MISVPRVTKGEFYPVYVEEWIDLFIGAFMGAVSPLLNAKNSTCGHSLAGLATQLAGLSSWFDKKVSTVALGLTFSIFNLMYIVLSMYTTVSKCQSEAQFYNGIKKLDLLHAANAASQDKPKPSTDILNLHARLQAAAEAPKPDYSLMDPKYMNPGAGDYIYLVVLVFNLLLASYGVYTTITSSYYWYNFGRNVVGSCVLIYIAIDLAINW